MRTPTDEQRAVLESNARLRVVRAAPGSGKTWLVAECVRRELEQWRGNGKGIAALSFTRVGGSEIRNALGYDPSHPHFVGTIDAFLFRYVVRPFLQRAFPEYRSPRLIPAEWSPKQWTKKPDGTDWTFQDQGGQNAKRYNPFEVCFTGEDPNGAVLVHPRPFKGGFDVVPICDRANLLAEKRKCWKKWGWVTHADAALLASEVLAHPQHGATIRSTVLRRFPLVIVDEVQDTGFFLCKCMRLLLSEPTSRGLVVGDPDQAIYEFNGARPDLFGGFEQLAGSSILPLAKSLRCPSTVSLCANELKDTAGKFESATGRLGRTFLVRYLQMVEDVSRIVKTISTKYPTGIMKVVSRWKDTGREFNAGDGNRICSLRCPPLTHIARAVQAFRCGQNLRALTSARATLELVLFGKEGITEEQLAENKVGLREWKSLAVKCLLDANALDSTLSMHNWQMSAGQVLDEAIDTFDSALTASFKKGKLKPHNLTGKNRKKAGADQQFAGFAPLPAATTESHSGLNVETVHAVKGETHDTTVVVWPVSKYIADCPSVSWWPTSGQEREERRIAYVAVTRTRGDLILCVAEACYLRLLADRPEFAKLFQCLTVDECIAAI